MNQDDDDPTQQVLNEPTQIYDAGDADMNDNNNNTTDNMNEKTQPALSSHADDDEQTQKQSQPDNISSLRFEHTENDKGTQPAIVLYRLISVDLWCAYGCVCARVFCLVGVVWVVQHHRRHRLRVAMAMWAWMRTMRRCPHRSMRWTIRPSLLLRTHHSPSHPLVTYQHTCSAYHALPLIVLMLIVL